MISINLESSRILQNHSAYFKNIVFKVVASVALEYIVLPRATKHLNRRPDLVENHILNIVENHILNIVDLNIVENHIFPPSMRQHIAWWSVLSAFGAADGLRVMIRPTAVAPAVVDATIPEGVLKVAPATSSSEPFLSRKAVAKDGGTITSGTPDPDPVDE